MLHYNIMDNFRKYEEYKKKYLALRGGDDIYNGDIERFKQEKIFIVSHGDIAKFHKAVLQMTGGRFLSFFLSCYSLVNRV